MTIQTLQPRDIDMNIMLPSKRRGGSGDIVTTSALCLISSGPYRRVGRFATREIAMTVGVATTVCGAIPIRDGSGEWAECEFGYRVGSDMTRCRNRSWYCVAVAAVDTVGDHLSFNVGGVSANGPLTCQSFVA